MLGFVVISVAAGAAVDSSVELSAGGLSPAAAPSAGARDDHSEFMFCLSGARSSSALGGNGGSGGRMLESMQAGFSVGNELPQLTRPTSLQSALARSGLSVQLE
jgi:hypothetical protein